MTASIEVEVYEMPMAEVGGFLKEIPPPLGLGKLELLMDDRSISKSTATSITGFIAEVFYELLNCM